jgi:hypothetical protein
MGGFMLRLFWLWMNLNYEQSYWEIVNEREAWLKLMMEFIEDE